MNWLKLKFKVYYCIVNYELKSCIYPCAQRFYYVDYIKPWIDEKPLNDYKEELNMKLSHRKEIDTSNMFIVQFLSLTFLLVICLFNIYSYTYITNFDDRYMISNITTTSETKPITFTYQGYYLSKNQYLYRSEYGDIYYSNVNMNLKQNENIMIDTVVTSQKVCLNDTIETKSECDHENFLIYLNCNELNIDEKVLNKEDIMNDDNIISELFPLLSKSEIIENLFGNYISIFVVLGKVLLSIGTIVIYVCLIKECYVMSIRYIQNKHSNQ